MDKGDKIWWEWFGGLTIVSIMLGASLLDLGNRVLLILVLIIGPCAGMFLGFHFESKYRKSLESNSKKEKKKYTFDEKDYLVEVNAERETGAGEV